MANSLSIFHPVNMFTLRLTGQFIQERKVCFGIFLEMELKFSILEIYGVLLFVSMAFKEKLDKHLPGLV